MSNFSRTDEGEIIAILTTQESQVLINLTEQLIELLGEGSVHVTAERNGDDPFLDLMGLSANISNSDAPPEDPVLRRLFPDAYEDKSEAAEFRRYTEDGLRRKKRAHALLIREAILGAEVGESGDKAKLSNQVEYLTGQQDLSVATLQFAIAAADIEAWLGGLNDLRLALAVRLDISTEFGKREESRSTRSELMAESDPMRPVYAVYSWLGWLQQSLLEILMAGGDEHQAS